MGAPKSKFKNQYTPTAKDPPGAQFIVLSEAAHSVNWESSRAFKRSVLELIRKHYNSQQRNQDCDSENDAIRIVSR